MPPLRRATLALIAFAAVSALTLSACSDSSSESLPENPSVIILSGDGMGSQQRTAIQYYFYGLDARQPMDALPYAGLLDTVPGDPEYAVTDSAAGATAWSIGKKVPNGMTGLGPNGESVPTLLDIAKERGMSTGLVNDHDITNATLIEDLYAREYAERVAGNRRLFLRGAPSVHQTEEDDDGVRVHILHHPTGAIDQIDCDAVIYATGFLPAPLRGILGHLYADLVLEEGQPVVSRDYRLATSPPAAGGLYIQGNTEHTHGLTSSLLSNIAVRSAEILQSIDANRHSPVGSAPR